MDTDWCLRCGRHTNEGNDIYCSKQCMVLDQSLAHSLPARTSYLRRASFDLPVVASSSPHFASITQPSQKHAPLRRRRAHPSDPTHNVTRFRDEELQALHAGAYHVTVPSQYPGKTHEGILRWAASVQPGLEEEEELVHSPASSSSSSSIPVDVDKLTPPPFFPLTAQNLAPPCVTIDPRHISVSVFHNFVDKNHLRSHHHQQRTAPSLVQSQDDASFFTPASESVNTPSVIPDAPSSTASSHVAKPLLGRFVNKISSWISSPAPAPTAPVSALAQALASAARPITTDAAARNAFTTPSPEEDLVHSDETLRVHAPYHEKALVVPIPKSLIRYKRPRLVNSPPYDYEIA